MTGAATAKNHTEDNNNGDRSWKHDLKNASRNAKVRNQVVSKKVLMAVHIVLKQR
jgi:hypothetical protein